MVIVQVQQKVVYKSNLLLPFLTFCAAFVGCNWCSGNGQCQGSFDFGIACPNGFWVNQCPSTPTIANTLAQTYSAASSAPTISYNGCNYFEDQNIKFVRTVCKGVASTLNDCEIVQCDLNSARGFGYSSKCIAGHRQLCRDYVRNCF